MSQHEVDQALRRLSTEADGIATALVDLDNHRGRRFLDETRLSGATEARWRETKAAIATLWERFALYQRVRDRALRTTDLSELTELLRGRSIELSTEDVPLAERGLTGPATTVNRISLADLVTAMTTSYREAAEVVTTAERVWSTYALWLDQMDARLRTVRAAAETLGTTPPVLTGIHDDVDSVRALVFSDPLSLDDDAGRQRRITEALDQVQGELDALHRLRDGFEQELDVLRQSLADLESAEAEARTACDTARAKIANTGLPTVADCAPTLRQRLTVLTNLYAQQNWALLSTTLNDLRGAVDDARSRAIEAATSATALLDRRSELRGRLDAYRVKAATLRYTEDPEISVRYQHAHALLFSAPCDLGAATRAVLAYQRAITDKGAAR